MMKQGKYIDFLMVISMLLLVHGGKAWAKQGFVVLPFGAYSEETSLQMGFLGIHVWDSPDPVRIPTAELAVIRSLNKQWRFVTSASVPHTPFWKSYAELNYYLWPAQYYGLGNTNAHKEGISYDMEQVYFEGDLERILWTKHRCANTNWRWSVAPQVRAYSLDIQTENTVGEFTPVQGNSVGFGLETRLDATDHAFWPEQGYALQAEARQHLGGWQYTYWNVHWRDYRGFGSPFMYGAKRKIWVLAYKGGAEGIQGDAPLVMYPSPDGVKNLRGVAKGLYRDKIHVYGQAELRIPLFWRIAGVGFVDFSKLGHESWSPWIRAAGVGGRVFLKQDEKLAGRVDLSWVNGSPGLAVYLREAF